MLIGVLSDTHDNLPLIDKAVEFFNKSRAAFVIHAGDFVAPFTVARLNRLSCDWTGVFGNNDGERKGLSEKSDGRIKTPPLRLTLEGCAVTVVHDIASIDPGSEEADCIIFGHSHKPEVTRRGRALMINPGECSGWVTGRPTVALVELPALAASIIPLE